MTSQQCDGFWAWGKFAWRRGLKQAINAASEQLQTAKTDDERAQAQSRLEELQRQQADAKRNGGWRLH